MASPPPYDQTAGSSLVEKIPAYNAASSYHASFSSPSPSTGGLPQRWMLHKTQESVLKSTLNISNLEGALFNAITTRSGFRSDIIIHQGQDTDSPPLAVARTHLMSFTVSLPGLHTDDVKVKTRWWKGTTPQVTFQMPSSDGQQRDYEWTNANGRWRLMQKGPSSGQVVALWTVGYSSSRLSGEFEFVGAGLTGELGVAFPYVSSIGALAIGKLMRDTVFTNASIIVAS